MAPRDVRELDDSRRSQRSGVVPVSGLDAEADEEERADEHLQDVEVGAGCTEIWEHLSEERGED